MNSILNLGLVPQQMALTSTFGIGPAPNKVPMFLPKLYKIVDDPATNDVICWSDSGDSFFVLDIGRLEQEHLGNYFKHKKFPSFVRQLNMYGFHKISHIQQGVLNSESTTEQFAHPYFRRGREDQLAFIERNKQKGQTVTGTVAAPVPPVAPEQLIDLNAIVTGISAIRRHQTAISAELAELKQSNQSLWKESMEARTRHKKQQDTINRIVKFLAGVFANPTPDKQRQRLMIEDKAPDTPFDVAELEDEPLVDTPSPQPSSPATMDLGMSPSELAHFIANLAPLDLNGQQQPPVGGDQVSLYNYVNFPPDNSNDVSADAPSADVSIPLPHKLSSNWAATEDVANEVDALGSEVESLIAQLGYPPPNVSGAPNAEAGTSGYDPEYDFGFGNLEGMGMDMDIEGMLANANQQQQGEQQTESAQPPISQQPPEFFNNFINTFQVQPQSIPPTQNQPPPPDPHTITFDSASSPAAPGAYIGTIDFNAPIRQEEEEEEGGVSPIGSAYVDEVESPLTDMSPPSPTESKTAAKGKGKPKKTTAPTSVARGRKRKSDVGEADGALQGEETVKGKTTTTRSKRKRVER